MAKSHTVQLTLTNNTGFELNYQSDWFDSGRLGDGWNWPSIIKGNGDSKVVECYEKDWAVTGCSGYVSYKWRDGQITFAFSNPLVGSNKLGVGNDGKNVWDNMTNHDYKTFTDTFKVGTNSVQAVYQCTGGDVNKASVILNNGQ